MREFERFRLTVRHSEKYGPLWVIHADVCEEPLPKSRTEHMTYDEIQGLRVPKSRISFYVYTREFDPVFARNQYPQHFADGYHKAEVCGDVWCFYDWEVPAGRTCGHRDIAYRNVQMPRQAIRIFSRYARLKARTLPYDTDHEIELSLATRERLCARYGHGTGQVRIDVDERCQDKFKQHFGHSPDFGQRLTQLEAMARGTTHHKWQEAVVSLKPDSSGFVFAILTPEGRTSLWGGLIYHEPDKESYAVELNAPAGAHWSIHT